MADVLSLDAAKLHLKVDTTADDALIADLTAAAVDHVERATGLVLAARDFTAHADTLGRWIDIRVWPVRSISAVTYADAAGAQVTLDAPAYRLANGERPARIVPIGAWPYSATSRGSVVVTGAAGFEDPADIPPLAMQAVRIVLAEFYQNRAAGDLSPEAERSVAWLLRNLKVKRL